MRMLISRISHIPTWLIRNGLNRATFARLRRVVALHRERGAHFHSRATRPARSIAATSHVTVSLSGGSGMQRLDAVLGLTVPSIAISFVFHRLETGARAFKEVEERKNGVIPPSDLAHCRQKPAHAKVIESVATLLTNHARDVFERGSSRRT